jgi:hypothetical protein
MKLMPIEMPQDYKGVGGRSSGAIGEAREVTELDLQ